jgi:hypothetical protein
MCDETERVSFSPVEYPIRGRNVAGFISQNLFPIVAVNNHNKKTSFSHMGGLAA